MKRSAALVVALVSLALWTGQALAGPAPALTSAPDNFSCSFVTVVDPNDAVQCSWDALTGATKYSVEAVASFDIGGGVWSADFDFGTALTTVTIPLSSFPADINGDLVDDTLLSLVLSVKGLAPPGRKDYNQHNPFSPAWTCTLDDTTCIP